MAGSITDKFDRVTDSTTGRPIVTTLAAPGKAIAAASITLAAATNWTTTTAIHFVIYNTIVVAGVTVKDGTSQTDWKGTLSGTTISNLTLTGGTDRAYSAGAIVELTPTAAWAKELYDALITTLNIDGTLKTDIVTTAKILNANVTPAKWTNPYKFSVYLTTATNTSAVGLGTKVPFNVEEFDSNNNYDNATNFRYTAPVAGFYQINWQVGRANVANDTFAQLAKNGAALRIAGRTNSGDFSQMTGQSLLQLAANDYLEVYAYGPATALDVSANPMLTYFSGFLVSVT